MTRFTLPNGLRALFIPTDDGTETATALVLVRVGSRYEYPALNGASHFIEHLLFKGTKRRPTAQHISRALDAIGADFNAFTGKNVTGYYVKMDARQLALGIDMLSDMIFHSRFDEAELNRERDVIIEEINMYHDNPIMHVEDLLEQVLFSGNTLGWEIAGTHETMKTMPREELLAYYHRFYVPENMIVVVAGNIHRDARTWIQKGFGVTRPSMLKSSLFETFQPIESSKPRVVVQNKKTKQVQLAMGFLSYGVQDTRNAALDVLSIILGGNMSSRLFVEVREKKGLAYFVRSSNAEYEEVGNFMIRAGLDPSRLKLAVQTIMKELRTITQQNVTSRELKEAKTFLQGKCSIRMEDSHEKAQWFASELLFQKRLRTPKAYLAEIEAVKASDVKKIAKEILNPKQMAIAVVGPYANGKTFLKEAGL